jgi:hypothetical protein
MLRVLNPGAKRDDVAVKIPAGWGSSDGWKVCFDGCRVVCEFNDALGSHKVVLFDQDRSYHAKEQPWGDFLGEPQFAAEPTDN